MTNSKASEVSTKFVYVDSEGNIQDADVSNDIFDLGGKNNELDQVGKLILENTLNGNFKKKAEPFYNKFSKRPNLCLDFYEERRRCLKQKILFKDPEFPANLYSVDPDEEGDYDEDSFEWKRPGEIVKNPQLIIGGTSRFDAQQGELGNCYMIVSTSTLAMHEELFYRVVPLDQSFTENYAGIFHFQFWQCGKWMDVVIDDRLPTVNGKLCFMQSANKNEFWSALLEKAYAKFYGSYQILDGGLPHEVMQDMTGGFVESYEIHRVPKRALHTIIQRAHQMGSMINLGIFHRYNPENEEDGLFGGHAYSCTGLAKVTHAIDGEVDIIRIRNPWGNAAQWKGPWGDDSEEWNFVTEEDKKNLEMTKDKDGEFWMSFNDFVREFSIVEICTLEPQCLNEFCEITGRQPSTSHTNWTSATFDGEWGILTSGGYEKDSWMDNPQYYLHIPDEGQETLYDGKCTFIFAISQKYERQQKSVDIYAKGIAIYRSSKKLEKTLEAADRDNLTLVSSPRHTAHRDVTRRVNLEPGNYAVIPSTSNPDERCAYLLRVLADGPFTMKLVFCI